MTLSPWIPLRPHHRGTWSPTPGWDEHDLRPGLWPPGPFPHSSAPTRGPPPAEFAMGPGQPENDEVAQECSPDDLDQAPEFDPAEPDTIPDNDLDPSRGE